MKQGILFIFCVLIISAAGNAQEVRQSALFKTIKNSDNYIWGYGESADYDNANKHALDDLIGKISVHVESKFVSYAKETNFDFKKYAKSVVSTYSSTTLTNAKELMFEKGNVYHILRYIHSADLQKIFAQRKEEIFNYLYLGKKAQGKSRIGDALRYYYWSYALYLSYPYRSELKAADSTKNILVGLLLNDRINELLSKINFTVADRFANKKANNTRLILNCTYAGKKVGSLDFRYNAGGIVSAIHEVDNGQAEVMLYGAEQKSLNQLNIRIKYKYLNKSYQDKELTSVLSTVNIPFFKKSVKNLNISVPEQKINVKKMLTPDFEAVNRLNNPRKFYRNTIENILIDITKKKYDQAYKYFTPVGKQMFVKLLQDGRVSVLPLTHDTLKIIQMDDEVMVRSVPMAFYFPQSNHQFTENVVFTFNIKQKIEAVSFAISAQTIAGIVNHSKKFGSVKDKYTLIKFMEFYKTAYSLKRLKYIKSIFSDNALIIVGTVLKKSVPIEKDVYKNFGDKSDEIVKYQRYTKKEYIERLEHVFNSKEYINIDFDDAAVRKANGNDRIYGIQIAQHYYSSTYNDFGYLFLMIDLRDSLKPTIYVRTWQPQKNPDGSIYGLEDFRMN